MTGAWLMGAWIASTAAALAVAAACALLVAPTRVGAIACFALVGVMGGVAQMATGGAEGGFAVLGVTALLALMAYAAGALTGDPVMQKRPPSRAAISVAAVTLCVLMASWPLAPAALWHVKPFPPMAAFDMARADDLFLALSALVGVAAAAAALLGFGERGVIGAARDGGQR